jgi:DNA sulfur modification protein DndD
MLIKKIELDNFRQFIGHQEVEFSTDPERNVTVLIGVNTSGKTTFVKAFEWILYNKKDFKDNILLNMNIVDNMSVGETQNVEGAIILEHNGKEYEIKRTHTYTCTEKGQVRQSLSSADISYLQQDGQTRTKIESEFTKNIEAILPEALSSYFFFGGERVGSISSRADIEASVKGLMGLDVLANAMAHLRTVIAKLKRGVDFAGDRDAQRIRQNLDGTAAQLQALESELQNINEQIDYYQGEKAKYAALLKANEPTAEKQKRREQLETIIVSLTEQLKKEKENFVSLFSASSFSFFGMPLLNQAIRVLNEMGDDTESVPEMGAGAIDYIIERGVCICGTSVTPGSAAEKYLLTERKIQPPESIGSLVRRFKEQAMDYLSTYEDYHQNVVDAYTRIRSTRRDLGFMKDELVGISKALDGQKNAESLETDYKHADARLRDLDKSKTIILQKQGAYKKDTDNYEKALDAYLKADTKNAKIIACIDYATAVFDWVNDAYQARESTVRSKLEEKVNRNFNKMYHGSRNITIDEKYRVKYYDVIAEESDGLKAVKSFAFISGLVDLAKEALNDEANVGPQYYPLVMDAPFSNVDEIHIRNISDILPRSAEQVIIAVMQKDWEPASPVMAPVVGRSYVIEKDTDADGRSIDTLTHIKEM